MILKTVEDILSYYGGDEKEDNHDTKGQRILPRSSKGKPREQEVDVDLSE